MELLLIQNTSSISVAPPALPFISHLFPALPHPSKPKPGLPGAPFRAGLPLVRAFGAGLRNPTALLASSGMASERRGRLSQYQDLQDLGQVLKAVVAISPAQVLRRDPDSLIGKQQVKRVIHLARTGE